MVAKGRVLGGAWQVYGIILSCSLTGPTSVWADTLLTDVKRAEFWRAFREEDVEVMTRLVSAGPAAYSSWSDDLLSSAMIHAAGSLVETQPSWSRGERLSALDLVALALKIEELVEDTGALLMEDGMTTAHRILETLRDGARLGEAELRAQRSEEASALESLLAGYGWSPPPEASTGSRATELMQLQARAKAYSDAADEARAEGRAREAQERYLKAIDVYREAVGTDLEWSSIHSDLALTHLKASRVAIYGNDAPTMKYHLNEAARHARLALEREPENPAHWRALSTVQGGLAAHAAAVGDWKARREYLKARLESNGEAARLDPADPITEEATAATHVQLAELALAEERNPDAMSHALRAVETYDRLVEEVPGNGAYQRGRYMAYTGLGIAEVRSGKRAAGENHLAQASALAQAQLEVLGDTETRILLALIEYERALASAESRDPRLALPRLERACELSGDTRDPRLAELRSLCDLRQE